MQEHMTSSETCIYTFDLLPFFHRTTAVNRDACHFGKVIQQRKTLRQELRCFMQSLTVHNWPDSPGVAPHTRGNTEWIYAT